MMGFVNFVSLFKFTKKIRLLRNFEIWFPSNPFDDCRLLTMLLEKQVLVNTEII